MVFSLATYNVLDLFGDDESYVAVKAAALGPIVRGLDADVIGLQEVASDAALAALLGAAGLQGTTVVHGSRDARGIGASLVTRLPVLHAEVLTTDELSFPAFYSNDPAPYGARLPLRRGFVSALLDAGPFGRVRVLVAHLKSGRGVWLKTEDGEGVEPTSQAEWGEADLRALVWRAAEALFLRRAADAAFVRGDCDHVVVMGDLNDVASSFPLRLLRGMGEHGLRSVADAVAPAERYSTLHRGSREAIDHILVSNELHGLMRDARFVQDGLLDLSTLGPDAPRPHGSDHAPLVARFDARKSADGASERDAKVTDAI